jgi:hypothetical protein
MIVKSWKLIIGGEENNYQVRLEAIAEAESIDQVRESLRGLLGNIRLTTAEVAADLEGGREYAASSLPVASDAENLEVPGQRRAGSLGSAAG